MENANLNRICKLLYDAFIEIRMASREGDNNISFWLADLLHIGPLAIAKEAAAGSDFSDTLRTILQRADERGIRSWVDTRLATTAAGERPE
ncbi:hypothetical protein [Ancylobacter vacuolatus]|uniref:Uncharacterized protein n=1 Tax=Ancylobacter vacuolatus TaxID=223389 RepID=A0ABU0DH07_9HYPH|nr:hypothetical protein [Ancylobacter vacuolatus]MDQ0347718.1 hypothetical protein [Ancylobacter vacuolatus]